MGRLSHRRKRDDFFAVDRVWERRLEEDGTYQYLTSWKGYDEKTWVPIELFNKEAIMLVRELERILDHTDECGPKPQWLADYEERKVRGLNVLKRTPALSSRSKRDNKSVRRPTPLTSSTTAPAKPTRQSQKKTSPSTVAATATPGSAIHTKSRKNNPGKKPSATSSPFNAIRKKKKKKNSGKKAPSAAGPVKEETPCRACNPANLRHRTYPAHLKRELNEKEFDWPGLLCDACNSFYHAGCVGRQDYETTYTDQFICPQCETAERKSTLYEVVAPHRYNFHEHDEINKPPQIGSKAWMETRFPQFDKEIKAPSPGEMTGEYRIVHAEDGHQFKKNFKWSREEWKDVFLIHQKEGLGLKVPSKPYGVDSVIDILKPDWPVKTVDVHTQHARWMTLGRYKHYAGYEHSDENLLNENQKKSFTFTKLLSVPPADRSRLYNILSLEITDTKLSRIITPPKIYKQLSLSEKAHKSVDHRKNLGGWRYYVERFCLLSMGGSFTDFHVDFGGSSVWYHVHTGKKVFYLVPPTKQNLDAFEKMLSSRTRDEQFFADLVAKDECWKLEINEGETAMIPAGWIHAVHTPVDSVVYGGNFLTLGGIRMQLEIAKLETRHRFDVKFRFPQFRFVHWIAARAMTTKLRGFKKAKRRLPAHFLLAAQTLYAQLQKWTKEKDENKGKEETYDSVVSNPSRTIELLERAILRVTGEKRVMPVEYLIDRSIMAKVQEKEEKEDEENNENSASNVANGRAAKKSEAKREDNKRKRAVALGEVVTAKKAKEARGKQREAGDEYKRIH